MGEAAAKESSMEDILSSIRKIISEDEGKNTISEDAVIAYEPVAELKHEPVLETVSEQVGVQTNPAPTANEDNKSLSLAEIAANVKAGVLTTQPSEPVKETYVERAQEFAQEAEKVGTVSSVPADEHSTSEGESNGLKLSEIVAKMAAFKNEGSEQPMSAEETAPTQKAQPTSQVQVEPMVDTTQVVDVALTESPAPVTEVEVEVSQPAVEAQTGMVDVAEQSAVSIETEADDFRTALMSPSSDDAVSGSFERLKRSAMDDMDAKTEAILRPMLREWLDENLPTMVERLVREEIERVSRGV